MNFDLDDEHIALRDAVQRFCAGHAKGRRLGASSGDARAVTPWAALADMGLTGLCVATELGGSGRGAVYTMLVMREFGRALMGGPYVAQIVMSGALINLCSQPAQRARWLAPMARGDWRSAPAVDGDPAHCAPAHIELRATRVGDMWRLDGRKTQVIGAEDAHAFLVLAGIGAGDAAMGPLGLFVVDAGTPGLTIDLGSRVDGQSTAQLTLSEVQVPLDRLLADPGPVTAHLEAAFDAANAALVADAAGAMDSLIDLCCEHLRTRVQFGAPLAKIQSLQHKIADMVIAAEQVESMAQAAAMAVDAGEPGQRRRIVSAAKMLAARWGREIGWQSIQLHGAMGMTDECLVGGYVKHLLAIGQTLGDHAFHRNRLARPSDTPTDPLSVTLVPETLS